METDSPPKIGTDGSPGAGKRRDDVSAVLAGYFWFILKNVIGWMLIIASPVLGVTVPGPGGIPMFLVGFALVTIPGKRSLTSRVMRGRQLTLAEGPFTFVTALISVLLTAGVLWYTSEYFRRFTGFFEKYYLAFLAGVFGLTLLAFLVTLIVVRLGLMLVNFVIRRIPWIRRNMRPWLKRKGINLLPARRRRVTVEGQSQVVVNPEILEFDEGYTRASIRWWAYLKPWLYRTFSLGVTLFILSAMVKPLVTHWEDARAALSQMPIGHFIVASMMFAAFLLFFRALVWRRIVKGFGHRLPYGASLRIWSTSELARYLPGAIWQVVGRVMLVKPYGVSGSVCSTTQVLELCVFLLANLVLAGVCWLYYGAKEIPEARFGFFTAIALVPALALLLHPKIFYGIVNFVLMRIGKPAIVKRLRGKYLFVLLAWTVLGLIWQSLAVYLIARGPLHLKIDWLWMMAGAYSLAWCAGFLAFWAPGGIGVREVVFVAALLVLLPESIRGQTPFQDREALAGVLAGLGILLRLWSVLGELMMAAVAYSLDYRGALGAADAPGRIREPVPR